MVTRHSANRPGGSAFATWLVGLTLLGGLAARANAQTPVTLDLDFESAVAVARLFEAEAATDAELDRVLGLPGVQALVRQVRRFDTDATDEVFRSTLRAAIEGIRTTRDPFQFQTVRARLDEIGPILTWIEANHDQLATDLGRRIADYSPSEAPLHVPVYLVLGGSSDGWARDGTFHVALHYFRDDLEGLRLLMAHELFHVAQNSFMTGPTVAEGRTTLYNVETLLINTIAEGTASLLWWPEELEGGVYVTEVLEAKLRRNRNRAPSILSLFELMLFRAYSDPALDPASVYSLGFSGQWDSPLYYLGFRLARAIEEHRGRPALRDLLSRPAVEFFLAYIDLYRQRPSDPTLLRFSKRVEEILVELNGA